ncbi:MAG: hypothetical protein HY721_31245 [Planctomycetes bacterium]|nr:hypothetical protein [Planctomycetota bacterium]
MEPGVRALPAELLELFWDWDLRELDLAHHREQIMERVLQDGSLEAVRWLLSAFGDPGVRQFVVENGTRRLDPKILSFWMNYYDLGAPPCTTRSLLIDNEMGWRY